MKQTLKLSQDHRRGEAVLTQAQFLEAMVEQIDE